MPKIQSRQIWPGATRAGWQILLFAAAIVMVAPVFWMVVTALKPEGEVITATPRWLPQTWTLDNFRTLSEKADSFPVGRWFLNSLGIALTVTFLVLLVTSTAAFALSRLRFKGRDLIFMFVVATMIMPGQVTLIPVFLIVQKLGLFNTYAGVILPGLASAFGVFLLRQFFLDIPVELEEAAYLDGASIFTIFGRVVLPLAKPALATLAIFTFMGSWNDFVWPLIVTNDLQMRTLPVGLQIFQSQYTTQYGLTMAAAVIATCPMLIAFLIFQRRITEGIALTGLKG